MKAYFVIAMAASCLAGCQKVSSQSGEEAYTYTLTEDGSAETRDRHEYASLGDVTFSRVQKYKLVAQTEAARKPHFVVLSVTKKVGKKVVDRDSTAPVFMRDGTYNLECSQYYDVKPKDEAGVDDPQCSLKLLGVLKSDAPATLKAS